MRLASVVIDGHTGLAVREDGGLLWMEDINRELALDWPPTMDALFMEERFESLHRWYREEGRRALGRRMSRHARTSGFRYAPLYRAPSKIWGIGLN